MRTIVIGVEDSAASERVLDLGLLEAQSTHCPVRVVHAWDPTAPGDRDGRQPATDLLDEAVVKALGRRHVDPEVIVQTELAEGAPGAALVGAAEDSALLVVGRRAGSAVAHLLLGSTSAYVLHHSAAPVMVVPGDVPLCPVHRVVVGFDGSPSARSALRWGHDAARRYGCPLLVVRALDLAGRAAVELVHELADRAEDPLTQLEREVAEVLPDPGPVQVTCRLSHLGAAHALVRLASDDDLLVVGSRGRSGLAGLVLGSVAAHCAQQASCAVVVVQAGHERTGS
jgi:nucleotide-binding universal stress UspA family protein